MEGFLGCERGLPGAGAPDARAIVDEVEGCLGSCGVTPGTPGATAAPSKDDAGYGFIEAM
jgi:hypothetical protein